MKIAVYGSLRSGFYNNERFSLRGYITKSSIRGAMYLMYSYPHLYREEVSNPDHMRDHTVEIYDISDELYAQLRTMELGAGYQEVKTTLRGEDGEDYDVVVFYSRDNYTYKNNFIEEYSKETAPTAWVADKVI